MSEEKTKTDEAYDTAKRVETRLEEHVKWCADRDEKLHSKVEQVHNELDRKIRNVEAIRTSAMGGILFFLLSAIGYLLSNGVPWQ